MIKGSSSGSVPTAYLSVAAASSESAGDARRPPASERLPTGPRRAPAAATAPRTQHAPPRAPRTPPPPPATERRTTIAHSHCKDNALRSHSSQSPLSMCLGRLCGLGSGGRGRGCTQRARGARSCALRHASVSVFPCSRVPRHLQRTLPPVARAPRVTDASRNVNDPV